MSINKESISANSVKIGRGGLTISYTELEIKGTLRYNDANKKLELYDGANWQNLTNTSYNYLDNNLSIGSNAGINIIQNTTPNSNKSNNIFIGTNVANKLGNSYDTNCLYNDNVFMGHHCADNLLTGNKNIFIGPKTGKNMSHSNNNIFV